MKLTTLALAIFLISTSSLADVFSPNMYTCKSIDAEEVTELVYSSTNMIGEPEMSLTTSGYTTKVSRVNAENSSMGRLISGFDPHIACASIAYTVILPGILLSDEQSEISFETMLVRTFSGGLRPQNMPGTLSSSTFTKMSCTATKVMF